VCDVGRCLGKIRGWGAGFAYGLHARVAVCSLRCPVRVSVCVGPGPLLVSTRAAKSPRARVFAARGSSESLKNEME
jgi:hypothetical protein